MEDVGKLTAAPATRRFAEGHHSLAGLLEVIYWEIQHLLSEVTYWEI